MWLTKMYMVDSGNSKTTKIKKYLKTQNQINELRGILNKYQSERENT
jgi:hypothetical protein